MASLHEDIIGGRGYGGFGGDGFGGGIGLIALLALLGRGGFGGLGGERCGMNTIGVDGLNNLQGAIDTNAILSKLATIEGLVPLTEAQVQLALAGVQSTLTNQGTQNTQYLGTQLQNLALGQLVQSNAIQTAVAAVDTNVDRQSCIVQNAIKSDGDQTRALIQSIDKANDSRLIVTQANEITELRHEGRRSEDRHSNEIQITNIATANALAAQRQDNTNGTILSALGTLAQSIHATNQAINIGGTQLASPTNTNTNVRA